MRQDRKLARKAGKRPPYPRILMVCEGRKTEKLYFEDLRQRWRVSSANWAVMPSMYGTGPEKVVEFAATKAKAEKRWDEVYCIFDRDEHAHFSDALSRARDLDGKIRPEDPSPGAPRFVAIPSIPCFELWYLYHYCEVDGERSRDEVQRALRGYVPEYDKALTGMLQRTEGILEAACKRAAESRRKAADRGNDNPSTSVDILVTRLYGIGKTIQAPSASSGERT